MKHLLFISICWLLAGTPTTLSAQSIRKDYREFTTQELADFKAVILEMAPADIPYDFNYYYANNYCSNINTTWGAVCHPAQYGEFYLPWHRTMLLDFEKRMRTMPGIANNSPYEYLSLPYWDWTTDNNPNAAQFWDNNLLTENQYVPDLNITRCLGSGGSCSNGLLPTAGDIQAALSLNTFYNNTLGPVQLNAPDFTHRMEAISLSVKKWVGPTMESIGGLEDPASFLHHAMLDKVWQQWEDQFPVQQSAILHGNLGMAAASASGFPIVTADQVYDSRYIPMTATGGRLDDVWYAAQGKVLLNGAKGQNFVASDVNQPYLYRYTTASTAGSVGGGRIYVGDIQRDASNNVISDQKGDFIIAPNVHCDFRAGGAIEFLPGFEASYGSVSEAKIITIPNGFAPDPGTGERENTAMANNEIPAVSMKCMPNPVTDRATLEYELTQESDVHLKVLDVSGKIVTEASLGIQLAGTHQYQLDASDLTPGMYCWMVDINGKMQTLKFVKNQP